MNVAPISLVVDDEPAVRELVSHCLKPFCAKVIQAQGGHDGLDVLRRQPIDVLFTDLCLPTLDGISLLREAIRLQPRLATVIMTGYASIETSIEGLRLGICDYVTKPITREKIRAALDRAMRLISPAAQAVPQAKWHAGELVAQSAAMCEILKLISIATSTIAPVLIEGEVGVGKGVIARAIHEQSAHASGPFIHVNCAALSAAQMQEALCRYDLRPTRPGSNEQGMLERARGGSLFLDHVDKLLLAVQAGLLDYLQEGRLDSQGRKLVPDFRVIAASTTNLQEAVAADRFHRGLFDHLNVISLRVPPLRYRTEDLRPLVKYFLNHFRKPGKEPAAGPQHLSPEAWDCLNQYDWPGNVRELATVIEHAVLMTEGAEISASAFPESLFTRGRAESGERLSVPMVGDLKAIERKVIQEVIDRCHGNKAAAARALGMHRRTLYRKLEHQ